MCKIRIISMNVKILNFSPKIGKRIMKLSLFSDNVYFEEEDATSNIPARVPPCYNATSLVDRHQVGSRYVCAGFFIYI